MEIAQIIKNSEIVLKGKSEVTKLVMCNILAKGHTLIEDVPGVGKTTLVKYLGKTLGLELSRIQFTNDLLPADIIGTSVFNKNAGKFEFHKGPLFGELILADELNRAPPKTQSALLQAMEEKTISVEGNHYQLPDVFIVLATQNPNMQIGTFDLPESQLDRFSMKIKMGYADEQSTLALLKDNDSDKNLAQIPITASADELLTAQKEIINIHLDDSLYQSIYKLLHNSRSRGNTIPLSNRCGIDLVNLCKAFAYINERDYVIPDDLHYLFPYAAGHRLIHPENAQIALEHKLANELLSEL